jgi:hypothetical protein
MGEAIAAVHANCSPYVLVRQELRTASADVQPRGFVVMEKPPLG